MDGRLLKSISKVEVCDARMLNITSTAWLKMAAVSVDQNSKSFLFNFKLIFAYANKAIVEHEKLEVSFIDLVYICAVELDFGVHEDQASYVFARRFD
jgi:hypothetical protein